MPGMTPANGQLVSFESQFEVKVKTDDARAELWVAKLAFDESIQEQRFSLVESFGANVAEELSVDTSEPGHLYRLRLFAANTGSSSGDGAFIDELNIPRLESGRRRDYLTMCSEGAPQLAVESGGTFVRAVIGSGNVVTRALLLIMDAQPSWPMGEFPVLNGATTIDFLLSSPSESTDLIHEVAVVDLRADGPPARRRLGPGATVHFVALVWDSDGGFDFTWTSEAGMPHVGTSAAPPEKVTTKERHIVLVIDELVCLDDSDDLSDGEAEFQIVITPSAALPIKRLVSWDPMETGSIKLLGGSSFKFPLTGQAADAVTVAVSATEDDSDSFPPDGHDLASASLKIFQFRKGPGTETFNEILTLDTQIGGDDFHFLMHCSVAVSYA